MPPNLAISGAGAGLFGGIRQGLAGLQGHFQNKALASRRLTLLNELERTKNEWATERERLRFQHDKQLQDERIAFKREQTPKALSPQQQFELEDIKAELKAIRGLKYGEFKLEPGRLEALDKREGELRKTLAGLFHPIGHDPLDEKPEEIVPERQPPPPPARRGAMGWPSFDTDTVLDYIEETMNRSGAKEGAVGLSGLHRQHDTGTKIRGILEFGREWINENVERQQASGSGLWNINRSVSPTPPPPPEPEGPAPARLTGRGPLPLERRGIAVPQPESDRAGVGIMESSVPSPPQATGRGPLPMERSAMRAPEPPPSPMVPERRLTGRGRQPAEPPGIMESPSTQPESVNRQSLLDRLRNQIAEWTGSPPDLGGPSREPMRAPEPAGVLAEPAPISREIATPGPRSVETTAGPGPMPTDGLGADIGRIEPKTAEPRGLLEADVPGSAYSRSIPRETELPSERTPRTTGGGRVQRVEQHLERTMADVGRKTFGSKERGLLEAEIPVGARMQGTARQAPAAPERRAPERTPFEVAATNLQSAPGIMERSVDAAPARKTLQDQTPGRAENLALERIMRHEDAGFRKQGRWYGDTKGPAIGYGMTRRAFQGIGVAVPDGPITQDQARQYTAQFINQIAMPGARRVVGEAVWSRLSERRKAVLAEIVYMVGETGFKGNVDTPGFTRMLEALRREDYDVAAQEIRRDTNFRPAWRVEEMMQDMREG